MKVQQLKITDKTDLTAELQKISNLNPSLILAFGNTKYFSDGTVNKLVSQFPKCSTFGCSTAGEISGEGLLDHTLHVNFVEFSSTRMKTHTIQHTDPEKSFDIGRDLAAKVDQKGLKALMLLSPGINVNAERLIAGMNSLLHDKFPITGGLAGDGTDFKRTFTLADHKVTDNHVGVLCFYGEHFEIQYGFMGGWEPFGPIKKITKAKDNVVFEIDNQPALDVYKKYLGEYAKQLPGTALMFPFSILKDGLDQVGVLRGVLGVDEKLGSLSFGGNVPEGALVRLMNAKTEGLIQGAKKAATLTLAGNKNNHSGLGILISCVARKLAMGIDTEDELEAVREIFGDRAMTGFYSYGEICPNQGFMECQFHNQTMTISYLTEKAA